ncbi:MAG: response regulator [Armatimonadetes bacterium CG_4_10_14_3_um_filter_66_18]|nr:response regulator [Armatimonadota bacterium]PIX48123.1 MAG: response regulator [Armatimonadetes bacterium CG_4_8_14_3_um_filter_66_20]PIY35281.1 MAG: response regulator [Armatimonadetes bacterium CG_4_10_14_3_um_filter_66_18]
MKILIAEDTPSAQLLLRRTLENWGHEVLYADNGAQALAALAESDVSLVVSDWMMPVMDGVELCRRIRAAEWDRFIYVLMLTAVADKEDLALAFDAGANDYVTKPFNRFELKAHVQAGERIVTLERERTQRIAELEESLRTIRRLKELLPICMYCRKIRNDDNYWQQMEDYVHEETGTDFSHGICPDCYETVVKPELTQLEREKESSR